MLGLLHGLRIEERQAPLETWNSASQHLAGPRRMQEVFLSVTALPSNLFFKTSSTAETHMWKHKLFFDHLLIVSSQISQGKCASLQGHTSSMRSLFHFSVVFFFFPSLYPQLYNAVKNSSNCVQTIRILWLLKQKRPPSFELTAGNKLLVPWHLWISKWAREKISQQGQNAHKLTRLQHPIITHSAVSHPWYCTVLHILISHSEQLGCGIPSNFLL